VSKVQWSRLWVALVAASSGFAIAPTAIGQTVETSASSNMTASVDALSVSEAPFDRAPLWVERAPESAAISDIANPEAESAHPVTGAVDTTSTGLTASNLTFNITDDAAALAIDPDLDEPTLTGAESDREMLATRAAARVATALDRFEQNQAALNTAIDPAQSIDPTSSHADLGTANPAPPTASIALTALDASPTDRPQADRESAATPEIAQATTANEPRVLVSEVLVRDDRGDLLPDLEQLVYEVIRTQPGRTTTSSQLQDDINAIYATGFFGRVEPLAEETPLGVRVIFVVRQNPQLNAIELRNNQVLTQEIVDEIFGAQYGRTLNLRDFQRGIESINRWYDEGGYALAQVVDPPPIPETGPAAPPPVSANGTVTIDVAEGEIEAIQIRYLNEDGEEFDENGEPVEGRTRPFIITREMETAVGGVFNSDTIQADLQRVFGLGFFDDVNLAVEPGTDPRKAILTINAIEGRSGSVAAGGGFSSSSGFFGTLSYQEQNLGGNAQRLGAEVQLGTRGLFFDANFTDPWIAGDPYRTSYNINLFKRRSISLVYDSAQDQPEVELPNGDRPRIDRTGAAITFSRPLSRNVFDRNPSWLASLGLRVQEVSIRDADGEISPLDEGERVRDANGNVVRDADGDALIVPGSQRQLAFNEDGTDFLATVRFGLSYDGRDDRLNPTDGYSLSVSTEQSLPFDGLFFNSVQASYSYFIPIDFTKFTDEGAETLAFNVRAGTILGDFPPYEAFILGGVNSVRGYEEGAVGSSRTFVQATAEYRFPILSFLGGVVFVDAATDLGTGNDVPGDPAGVRDKPGSGFGYGLGLRINSPIGPIRVDFGVNDESDSRFHFGIGQRF
jgi:outer membrane protein insertion porin family